MQPKFLELITLRSLNGDLMIISEAIQSFIQQNKISPSLAKVEVYLRICVDSDISVHLIHTSTAESIDKSDLGVAIAEFMKSYGLIHHSIWKQNDQ